MTRPARTRFMLALLAGLLLTTLVAGTAEARLPHARHYRAGGHLSIDTTLLSRSGLSAWAIDEYLAAHTSLPPLGAAFMAAEHKYGINARFLVAAAMHESGWGSGYIARVKHNLFGYNAYDRNPLKYANAYGTYAANIDDTARFIKDFYLTPTGRWWGGQPTLRSMQLFWSSSDRWGVLVSRIANQLQFDTLRHRRITFAEPQVTGPVHHGVPALVTLAWSGGALPATLRFKATWEPVELDADVVSAATSDAAAGMAAVGDAAVLPASGTGPALASAHGNPAPAGDIVTGTRRIRGGAHSVSIAVATPQAPGRYVLHLALLDVGGGPLPAPDRIAIPGVDVREFADRAVGYAITAGQDDTGAVVRITNTGRKTIPASAGVPAPASNNPEIEVPRTIITVTSSDGTAVTAETDVLASTPLRSDLAPGASVTVTVPGGDAANLVVSMSVLGDPTWLGATASSGPVIAPATAASTPPAPPTSTPAPTPAPTVSPTPTPTPTTAPTPAPAPTNAPAPKATPHPKRHVTTLVTERSGAISYRGPWAGASSSGYLGGHVAWSSSPGATASITFTGTSIAWIGPVGPTRGRALVVLDGRVVARINLWRSSFDPRATLFRRSFAATGRHRLTIEVLSAPGHPIVAIDGFLVRS